VTHKGDFTPGKTVIVEFNTHKADGTPITLAGTPAVSVYKNSTTQSTAGVSLTVDYDSLTGLQHVAIDTSADGTFYAAGNDFRVVITAGTVDSISVVGTVVGSFSLSNRSALRPATADRTLAVDAAGKVPATVATGDDTDAASLLARLTASRAGYLDNLNVGGAVASYADIDALNQSASRRIILTTVQQYERPESSSSSYTIEARTYDGDGAAVNADTTPTLTATGIVSGSLAANLSAATNPSTGVYRWTYTVASGATVEQIRFDVSATLSSAAFTLSAYAQVTDFVSATFTTTNQSHLEAIYNKLPTNNIADETLLLTAIGTPMQAGTVTLASSQPNYAPAKAGDAMTLTSGERDAVAAALLDLSAGVETGLTLRQAQRVIFAAAGGKLAGAATGTITIRDKGDTKNRITATVDADGNRTAVTLDLT